MIGYSIEPGNTWKDKDFCHSGEIYLTYSGKKLLETATKVGLDALKTASKIVAHKLTEATGEFIRKKIADEATRPKPMSDTNSRNIEETVIPPEKREEILNKLR